MQEETKLSYVAAWVPENDPRSWDDAAKPAVEWVLQEAERQKRKPLLVTATQHQWDAGTRSITWFAQKFAATTPRSKQLSSFHGPVLAFVPDYETMNLAAHYAKGSSLAVVESDPHPLVGWAMEVKALNLLTGEVTPDPRTEDQRNELDRIHFYGNNGWASGFGRDQATRVLRDLLKSGDIKSEIVLGYMLAKGHSHKSIDGLAVLIKRLA